MVMLLKQIWGEVTAGKTTMEGEKSFNAIYFEILYRLVMLEESSVLCDYL
jgi:hypothetical protein